jgi:hypothetical protein
MTVKQVLGEWYWGAKCPECGAMSAHAHDPMRGQVDSKIANEKPDVTRVAMACPNGHRFDAATESLLSFEWGAQ